MKGTTGHQQINIALEHYWYGRQQFVEYDDIMFNAAIINTGVSQGSILGPLLLQSIWRMYTWKQPWRTRVNVWNLIN